MAPSARVLVVEDDRLTRTLLVRILEGEGYAVDEAGSAEAALAALGGTEHDAVLLDLRMPGISGLDALPAVRERRPDAVILMVTAVANLDIAVEAMKRGADDFITKPFRAEQVTKAVAESLAKRRARRETRRYLERMEREFRERAEKLATKDRDLSLALDELRRTRRDLVTASRLSSIGLLTQGIVHNMRGPLTAIAGFAGLLKDRTDEPEKVDVIIKESRRLSAQIQTILDRGKNARDEEPRSIDLSQLLRDEIAFLDADLFFKHLVTKEIQLSDSLPEVVGAWSDFSQAFSAVLQNAIDAMRNSGTRVLAVRATSAGGAVAIEIEDSGEGIPADQVDRIFEPFFSTRKGGETGTGSTGMGLGLFIAREVLAKYKAAIEVRSTPGSTRFTIRIPASVAWTGADERGRNLLAAR